MPLHFIPWTSWHSEVIIFFAVFLSAWILLFRLLSNNPTQKVKLPYLVLPFVIMATIASMQLVTGVMTFGGDALIFFFYGVLCILSLIFGFLSSRQKQFPETATCVGKDKYLILTFFAFIFILGSFLSVIVALVQVFELWEHSAWINRMPQLRRPGGNLAQPNHLATLVLMGLASLLFVFESGKLKKLPSLLLLLLMCIGLAITESRTGALSLLLLWCWWCVKKNEVTFRASPLFVFFTIICFLGLLWYWPSIFILIQKNLGTGVGIDTKAGLRLVVWPQLLEAVSHSPWWGWGLGEVVKAHNSVVHNYLVSEPFSYAHNILLDMALGIGVPLTVVFVSITCVWLWCRSMLVADLQAWYCLAVALPFVVHSMFEFPFSYAYFLAPVLFAVGVLEGKLNPNSGFAINARLAVMPLFAFSVLASWSVVEYINIEEDFRIARFEALNIGQKPINYVAPNVVLLTQLKVLLTSTRIVPKPGMTADELDTVKKAALRYPWSATQHRYALSLALNGNGDEAIRQLKVIRALHGEKFYQQVKKHWLTLGEISFPQLKLLMMP